ncbi:MAG: hypothetical protein HOM21_01835, partial [Halobacteriovoraceae bacterium]|nr:hypothetical protein [Halobacteriovoraceae bacterium]
MSVRQATLEEWFLVYQLDRIKKDHFHLPFNLDIDISRLSNHFQKLGEGVPITA